MSHQQALRFIEQATHALQRGELQQALSFADQAIVQEPTNADAHLMRGIVLSQLGERHSAASSLNTAIQLSPHDPKGFYNLALHYRSVGQTEQAQDMARQTLRVDPRHAGATAVLDQLQSAPTVPARPPSIDDPSTGPPGPAEVPDWPATPPAVEAPVTPATPPVSEQPSMSPPPEQPAPPYGSAPSGPPYQYQQPQYYAQPKPPLHSLRFIEGMGVAWTVVALGIAALSLYAMIQTWSVVYPMFEPGRSQAAIQRELEELVKRDAGVAWILVFNYLICPFLAFLWLVFDLFDRRGPWWWMAVLAGVGACGLFCLSPGLPWIFIPIYLLFRRK